MTREHADPAVLTPLTDDMPGLAVFSIDRYDVGHALAVERDSGVRVVTDPRQWSHALEFRPRAAAGFEDGPLLVEVGLEVESGRIEVGALSTEGTAFLAASMVEPGSHTIVLRVPALARCQSISIRNAAPVASTARVVAIEASRDSTAADDPELSAPYGSSRRGFWDKNIFADLRRLAGADCGLVFQAGAHEGGETSLLLQMFPEARVYGFEPSPQAVRQLRDRFAGRDRAIVEPIALSDQVGMAPFHINARSETNSLFPMVPERAGVDASAGSTIQVQVSTVDEQLDRLKSPRLDVLCLDTQGAELAILRGASRALQQRRISVLMAELIWQPLYEGQGRYYDVLHFLGNAGYALYDFYNFHHSESGELLWGDALFLPGSAAPSRGQTD